MRVLITSGTGNVGRVTAPRLMSAGIVTRVLTRSADHADRLPSGVEIALGDLADRDSLKAALREVDRVFLITPLHPQEAQLGRNVVDCAREAGVSRVVMMGVHRAESAPEVPHFASKLEIEASLRASGLAWSVLMANMFQQNDLWFRDALVEHGVYPQPFGNVGASRVDVRDIADAALAALTQPGHEGVRYPLVGPEVLTADQTADLWSRHLGRAVVYAGDDLDAWAAQAGAMLPPWLLDDLRAMYHHFQRHGMIARAEELALQERVLEHPPRRFEEFVAETAAAWRGCAGAPLPQ